MWWPAVAREAVFDHPQTAAAAAITGCKNLSPAQKNGPYTLYARDWETTLTAAEPVGEDVAAVGLRAHFFTPVEGPGENVFPLTDPHVNEAPFSVSVYFQAGNARIRWEIDRSRWAEYQGKLPRVPAHCARGRNGLAVKSTWPGWQRIFCL